MTYQEKKNIVNMVSAVLITGIYAFTIFQRQMQGRFDLTEDFVKWGILFLIFAGVSVGARIIIYIIFHIINAIATREDDIPVTDERDKLIKLKSTRNAHFVISFSFIVVFIFLAVGIPVYWIFVVFVISGLLSEIADNSSQIYYYRKGV